MSPLVQRDRFLDEFCQEFSAGFSVKPLPADPRLSQPKYEYGSLNLSLHKGTAGGTKRIAIA